MLSGGAFAVVHLPAPAGGGLKPSGLAAALCRGGQFASQYERGARYPAGFGLPLRSGGDLLVARD